MFDRVRVTATFSTSAHYSRNLIGNCEQVFTCRECVNQITKTDPNFKVAEMLQKQKLIGYQNILLFGQNKFVFNKKYFYQIFFSSLK